jgi:putative effector of murein hydrolase
MNELFTTIFWSGVTLAAFFGWRRIFLALKHPVLHPILWATLAVVILLALGRHSVAAYREESAPLSWLLGPAVVAMAVPVWQRRQLIAANWKRLLLVVVLGIAFSAFSVLLLGPFVGWREAKSLVPKSVTTPVALGIIKEGSLGRAPQNQLVESVLGIGIMISALSGAVFGPLVLQLTGVRDRRAVGLALGCTSIGVGTARAFEIDSTAGAFATIGMTLTAICAGFVLPCLLRLI